MTIEQERIGKSTVVLSLVGRLDTANAPLLERKIKQWGEDITEMVLDFSGLDYISSMGLRVLLQAKKTLKAEGRRLVIKNMGDSIREVFEITGFLSLMVQEEKFVAVRKDESGIITLSFNGEMKNENIPDVAKELSEIKEQNSYKSITVILDMEKVSHASIGAVKALSQAIADTAWEKRNLCVRNANESTRIALESEGLGNLVE